MVAERAIMNQKEADICLINYLITMFVRVKTEKI